MTATHRPGGTSRTTDASVGWTLAPGTRLLWRGAGEVQLERAGEGVVVTGLDGRLIRTWVRRPADRTGRADPADDTDRTDHTHDTDHTGAPTPHPADRAALDRLVGLGYLHQHGRPHAPRPGATRRGPDARRVASLEIVGRTRVSAYLGALLATSGVGRVAFRHDGVVTRRDLLPGGLTEADEGRRFAAAAADVVARAAPATSTGPLGDAVADLVVLCVDAPVDPDVRDILHRNRLSHLVVHLDAERGEVGPLVVPGVSPCLRCADLHRVDRDPAWTLLAVQRSTPGGRAAASDPALAARVGALAATLILRWLDDPVTAPVGASWEVRDAWISPRRRTRAGHPACECRGGG